MLTRDELIQWMRTELPRLLQEDPAFRAQVIGILSEALVSKGELTRLLDELRAMREESQRRFEAADRRFEAIVEELRAMRADFERRFEEVDRRFEAVDRRFEAADRRFEAIVEELRTLRSDFEQWVRFSQQEFAALRVRVAEMGIGLGSLGLRMGQGLEEVIRQVIESFSGAGPLKAARLVLIDEAGELYQPGARVEIDALVTDGRRFLVEVKNYAKTDEVWAFHRKARFAEAKLGETFEKVLIAPAATASAVALAKQLGIICYTLRAVESRETSE